jgi:hypothetical protein
MTRPGTGGSKKVEQCRQELLDLNQKFRNGQLLGRSFYAQLGLHGCDPKRSVLVVLVPEGADTFSGNVIKQDGTVLGFDIDLDAPELSQWEDLTQKFHEETRRLLGRKPWAASVVAYALFRERGREWE